MADESAVEETTTEQTTKPSDGEGKKPTPYELELRKENEKLRKKLEARLKEEEEAKKKALEEQGKYRELYEAAAKDLEPMKAELAKYRLIEQQEREAILKDLPEDQREIWSGVPITALKTHHAAVTKQQPPVVKKAGPGTEERKWLDLSADEQNELRASDRVKYRRLYTEYYRAKNGQDPPFIP